MAKKPIYADLDLFILEESDQIKLMAQMVREGQTICFIAEDDEKADRYLKKLGILCKLHVTYRGMEPVEGTVMVKVEQVKD